MNQTEIQNHDARALANYRKGNLLILLATAVVIFVGARSLRAATLYWDGNGSTTGVGGTGTWSGAMFSTNSSGGGTLQQATSADTVNFNAASGGTTGNVITLASGTWTQTNVGTMNFNSTYVLTTSGSANVAITNNSTTIASGANLILSNGSSDLGFVKSGTGTGTISGAGAANSTLTLAQGTSTSSSRTVRLTSFEISDNLAINVSSSGTGYVGFLEGGGTSTIRANATNNTTATLFFGANSSCTMNVNGVVSGTGKVSFSGGQNGGSGTVFLNNVNTYTGDTFLNMGAAGKFRLGTNNAISTVSSLRIGTVVSTNGGQFDLNGFNQTLAGLSSGIGVGNVTNTVSGTTSVLTINQSTNNTFGLAIGGNLALVKTNAGNLILSGSNTYTGATTVSGGTLTASNNSALGSSSVSVGSGGTLSILANIANSVNNSGTVSVGSGGTLTAASLGTGALSLAGAATNSRASFVSTQAGSSLNIGNLTLGGFTSYSMASDKTLVSSGTITLSGTNNSITLTGSGLGVGTYNLFSGNSVDTSALSTGGLTLGGGGVGNSTVSLGGGQTTVGRTTYDFTSTATALQLVVGGGAFNVVWNGGDGAWDTTTANWQKDGAGSNIAFYGNDNVTISAGNTLTVDAAGVTTGSLVVDNSSGTTVLTGGSVAASSLAKSGAGALVISNAMTAINGLSQSTGALTTVGNLTISNTGVNISGGTANLNGNNSISSGGLTVSGGTAVLNGSNTISGGGLNISSGSLTVNSTNSISGGLNVTGGTATINSSSNSISGGVNANGGVLVVNANGALGNNSISMNGGTLAVGTLDSVTNAITLGSSGGTVTNNSAYTLSGSITGANNTLIKKGSGDLNLAGAVGASGSSVGLNIQEGNVAISGGSFKYLTNSTLNGNLVLSNGMLNTRAATFGGTGQVQVVGANNTWQANSSQSTVTNQVNLVSGATLNISNSVNMNLLGGMTGSGNVVVTAGSGGGVYITGTAHSGTLTNNTANEIRFYNADVSGITSFGGSGSGTLMFSNSTGDRTVGGKITGAQALSVRGTSVTTFTNTQNDFTNTINVNGSVSGTTAKFVGNSLGAASATAEISLGNTNTLYLDGSTSQRSLGIKTGGGAVFVAGDSFLGALTNNTAGQILTKTGSGNLTFTGLLRDATSTDAPILKISEGKVTLGASSSTSQYITVNSNADNYVGDLVFLAGNQASIQGTGRMAGGGKIIFAGNDSALQTSSTAANDGAVLTIDNDILLNSGAGTRVSLAATTSNSLVLNNILGSADLYFGTQSGGGGGVTTLNGTLSQTGNVYMNLSTNGILRMGGANRFANNQGIVMYRSNSTGAATASGTIDLNGYNQTISSLQSLSNNAAYMGVITSSNAATLTVNQSSDTTYGGTIDGALDLVKNGGGILTLASTNTMSGGVTVNGGGIYLANSSKGLGTGTLTLNGGRLGALGSGYVVTNAVVISADSSFGKTDGSGNSLTLSGGVDLGGGTRVLNLDNSLTVSGGLSNGALVIDTTLNRNFTVSGNATYDGGTTVRGGNFRLSGSGALNSTGAFNLAATTVNPTNSIYATLDISGLTGSGTTLGSLAGAGNSAVLLGAKNLTVGGNNSSTSYAGAISGTGGSLTKSGSGKFTLSGINSYTGATTVNGGTLEVASGGNISSSASSVNSGGILTVNGTAGNVTVNDGGTLKGSGTVGALEIASGGTLAVGNSPGVLTASSATWNGGGTYSWEFASALGNDSNPLTGQGTNWDFLNVAGVLDITASSGNEFIIDIVSLLALSDTSFNQDNNYSFAIATATGGITNFDVSDFSITGFLAGSNKWSLGLVNNTGSSQTLTLSYTGATAIPEPSTGSLLLVGLLGAMAARRRRS